MILDTNDLPRYAGRFALVDGVFDPLHAGHLAYFLAANRHGPLCCHISDVQRHPPLLPVAERAAVLNTLCTIAHVIPDESTEHVIRALRPRAFIKGADWRDRLPPVCVQACAEVNCPIVYTDTGSVQSSTALLKRWQRANDDTHLDLFERRVMHQAHQTRPWQPVTDYSFEGRKVAEGEHPARIWRHLIETDDADVLDYGCGPDGHLVKLLSDYRDEHTLSRQTTVEGYDPHARWPQLRHDEPPLKPVWDLVICREVLEHLTLIELRRTVTKLCRLSARYVYVTTRFHPDPAHLLDWVNRDDLDPDHRTLLNQDFLRMLFVLEGFRRRTDLEAAMDWKQLGRVLVYEQTDHAPRTVD